MKAVKIMILFLIASVIVTGCAAKTAKKPEDVQKLLMRLKSYKCDVVLAVTNNKSTNVYKETHMYKYPDKYRIEVLEPNEMKGQTTVYNGQKAYIYHPQIKAGLATENFANSLEYRAFFGAFIEDFKDQGGARYSMDSFKDKECFVLEIPIKENSSYRALEKIWIDAESILPVKAEILDKNNNVNAQILFENFEANAKLDDALFQLETE